MTTIATTRTSAEQLDAELVRIAQHGGHLPYNYEADSRYLAKPGDGGRIRTLLATIGKLGIRPTALDAFDRLSGAGLPTAAAPAGRYLDMSVEEWQSTILESAQNRVLMVAYSDALGQQLEQLRSELRESMASEADDYIVQLQPLFDRAMAQVQACLALGISPTLTSTDAVMRLGQDATAAWLRLLDVTVPALSVIATARIEISQALGVAPANTYGQMLHRPMDYAAAFTLPFTAGAFDLAKGQPEWRRWLNLASTNPHLCTGAEVTGQAQLEAKGMKINEAQSATHAEHDALAEHLAAAHASMVDDEDEAAWRF